MSVFSITSPPVPGYFLRICYDGDDGDDDDDDDDDDDVHNRVCDVLPFAFTVNPLFVL